MHWIDQFREFMLGTDIPDDIREHMRAIEAWATRNRAEPGEWTQLVSSNLKRCRFTPATAELEIEFNNGASWTYIRVPADVAAQLAIAESPGKFFHANIRGKFEGAGTAPHSRGQVNAKTEEHPAAADDPEDAERATNPRQEEDQR